MFVVHHQWYPIQHMAIEIKMEAAQPVQKSDEIHINEALPPPDTIPKESFFVSGLGLKEEMEPDNNTAVIWFEEPQNISFDFETARGDEQIQNKVFKVFPTNPNLDEVREDILHHTKDRRGFVCVYSGAQIFTIIGALTVVENKILFEQSRNIPSDIPVPKNGEITDDNPLSEILRVVIPRYRQQPIYAENEKPSRIIYANIHNGAVFERDKEYAILNSIEKLQVYTHVEQKLLDAIRELPSGTTALFTHTNNDGSYTILGKVTFNPTNNQYMFSPTTDKNQGYFIPEKGPIDLNDSKNWQGGVNALVPEQKQ